MGSSQITASSSEFFFPGSGRQDLELGRAINQGSDLTTWYPKPTKDSYTTIDERHASVDTRLIAPSISWCFAVIAASVALNSLIHLIALLSPGVDLQLVPVHKVPQWRMPIEGGTVEDERVGWSWEDITVIRSTRPPGFSSAALDA